MSGALIIRVEVLRIDGTRQAVDVTPLLRTDLNGLSIADSEWVPVPDPYARGLEDAAGGQGVMSPYLTTAEAAAYCRFKDSSTIRHRVCDGRVKPDVVRGTAAKPTYLFRRETLDAMLTAESAIRALVKP